MAIYKCKKCNITFNPNDVKSVAVDALFNSVQLTYKDNKLWDNGAQQITFNSLADAREAYEEISDVLAKHDDSGNQ